MGAVSTAIDDLNGDGDVDLIVAHGGTSMEVSVLLGDGIGGFASAVAYVVGPSPSRVAVGDLNNDGVLDIATLVNPTSVSVLLGDGTGSFTPLGLFPAGFQNSLRLADLDGDGILDAVGIRYFGGVSVILGDGTGGFGPSRLYAARNAPRSVTVADIDRDTAPDLIVANSGSHDVSVLLNRSRSDLFLRGDANGDGDFDIGDALFTLGVIFVPGSTPTPCLDSADANDDGSVDVADAIATVSALFLPGTALPPAPHPACGDDPTEDALDCTFYECP